MIDENFIITSLEEPLLQFLEKENLSLEECIIFYDRYHDDMEIPLASISRGIMTYDEDMRLEDVLKPARSFSSFFCNFDFAFLQCGSFYTEQQAIASEEIVYRLLINQLQDKEESLRNFTEQGLKAFYDERYRKNVKNEADFKSIQNLCEPFIKTNL